MKDKSNFQIILTSIFVFCIVLGVVAFSFYRASQSKEDNIEVTIWGTINGGSFNTFISKLKTDFNIELKAKYVEKDSKTIDSDLVEAIASGKGPDIVLLPHNLIVRYFDKVYPIPFASYKERTYLDTFVEEGKLYLTSNGILAFPFFVDPLVMYWNRDIFSASGIARPPTKWSEFPLLAGKISKVDSNANVIQSLVALGGYRNIENAKALISALLMQAGTSIVGSSDGTTESTLDKKSEADIEVPAISALRFYTEYANPRKSVYSWNSSLSSAKQMFLAGDLAIYFGKASELADIRAKNPNLNFDVAMLPQALNANAQNIKTFGDIQGFAILKSSKNILPAFNTIMTLVGPTVSSAFIQNSTYAPARNDIIVQGTADPIRTIFYNSALISRGWLDPNSTKTDQIFGNLIEDITSGRASLEDAVKKASQELQNLF